MNQSRCSTGGGTAASAAIRPAPTHRRLAASALCVTVSRSLRGSAVSSASVFTASASAPAATSRAASSPSCSEVAVASPPLLSSSTRTGRPVGSTSATSCVRRWAGRAGRWVADWSRSSNPSSPSSCSCADSSCCLRLGVVQQAGGGGSARRHWQQRAVAPSGNSWRALRGHSYAPMAHGHAAGAPIANRTAHLMMEANLLGAAGADSPPSSLCRRTTSLRGTSGRSSLRLLPTWCIRRVQEGEQWAERAAMILCDDHTMTDGTKTPWRCLASMLRHVMFFFFLPLRRTAGTLEELPPSHSQPAGQQMLRLRIVSSATPTNQHPGHLCQAAADAHVSNARQYALARTFEVTRQATCIQAPLQGPLNTEPNTACSPSNRWRFFAAPVAPPPLFWAQAHCFGRHHSALPFLLSPNQLSPL